jgi:alkyl sulfatase BDS1-like metallo-beta-lactamase superfamily hydrolase
MRPSGFDEIAARFQGEDLPSDNPVEKVWRIPSFGNTGVVETSDGLVLVDVPTLFLMPRMLEKLRQISTAPVHSLFLTHGHLDHGTSLTPLFEEAQKNGNPIPRVIAHRNVPRRLNRYKMLHGYHEHINRNQFGVPEGMKFFPLPDRYPDILFDKSFSTLVGGIEFHAYHEKGETDDHLWVWVPEKKTVFAGDMVVFSFPNVGNPFKVQRYTLAWAEGLEHILAKDPEVLIPGHGPVIQGKERIRETLLKTSSALRYLHDEVVKRLNQGMWYEDILHDVKLPDEMLDETFLAPRYGSQTFVLHGILREYAGWYDGNPSNLFPPKKKEIAKEVSSLVGKKALIQKAESLEKEGREDMALQFVDLALAADLSPEEEKVMHRLKGKLLEVLGDKESSLIARNIFYVGSKRELALVGEKE